MIRWRTRCSSTGKSYYDYLYLLLEKIILVNPGSLPANGIHLLFSLRAIRQQFSGPSKSKLVDYDLPRERLRKILDKFGIVYVDMTEAMLKSIRRAACHFDDGHINQRPWCLCICH